MVLWTLLKLLVVLRRYAWQIIIEIKTQKAALSNDRAAFLVRT